MATAAPLLFTGSTFSFMCEWWVSAQADSWRMWSSQVNVEGGAEGPVCVKAWRGEEHMMCWKWRVACWGFSPRSTENWTHPTCPHPSTLLLWGTKARWYLSTVARWRGRGPRWTPSNTPASSTRGAAGTWRPVTTAQSGAAVFPADGPA